MSFEAIRTEVLRGTELDNQSFERVAELSKRCFGIASHELMDDLDEGNVALAYSSEENVVGYSLYTITRNPGFFGSREQQLRLLQLAVDAPSRVLGIGRTLLATTERRAVQLELPTVGLFALKSAQGFYIKQGYTFGPSDGLYCEKQLTV